MSAQNTSNKAFYIRCLACLFATVWLLPNHYAPWGSFHNDALSAVVLLITASVVLASPTVQTISWHWPTLLAATCALVPAAQFGAGQILWLGTAWVNCAYLLGLCCALALGAAWEKQAPHCCGDFLFTGIVSAAILSMLIGLCQWLRLDVSDVWLLKTEGRPYGNLGQPNQLASLYVLATVGCVWLCSRQKISIKLAVFLNSLLLIGLVMTGSRTGGVNVLFVCASFILWSLKTQDRRWAWSGIFVFCSFFMLLLILLLVGEAIDIQRPIGYASRSTLNGRTVVWQLIIDAILQRPLFGYGWGQTTIASLNVAIAHPHLDSTTHQAHNLFLDLMVWNGVIVGGMMIVSVVCWMTWAAMNIKTSGQVLMFVSLCVLLLHAMSEYPLHYAYFLLPAGLMVGVLSIQLNARVVFRTGKKTVVALFLAATCMLVVTVKDYSAIETGFRDLRLEKAGVKTQQIGAPPDVWVLTNLRAALVMGRWKPTSSMTAEELNTMHNIALTYPSVNNIYTLAVAYELNGQRENASRWLQIGCKTALKITCQALEYEWMHDTRLPGTSWPSPSSTF